MRRLRVGRQLRWRGATDIKQLPAGVRATVPLQELKRYDWQMTKTAAAIGISRKNLWERLRRLNLTLPARVLRQEDEQTPAD